MNDVAPALAARHDNNLAAYNAAQAASGAALRALRPVAREAGRYSYNKPPKALARRLDAAEKTFAAACEVEAKALEALQASGREVDRAIFGRA